MNLNDLVSKEGLERLNAVRATFGVSPEDIAAQAKAAFEKMKSKAVEGQVEKMAIVLSAVEAGLLNGAGEAAKLINRLEELAKANDKLVQARDYMLTTGLMNPARKLVGMPVPAADKEIDPNTDKVPDGWVKPTETIEVTTTATGPAAQE